MEPLFDFTVNSQLLPAMTKVSISQLDHRGIICGLDLLAGDRVVSATVSPRRIAYAAFTRALTANQSAYLLMYDDSGQITLHVPPSSSTPSLRLSYTSQHCITGGSLNFHLPHLPLNLPAPAGKKDPAASPETVNNLNLILQLQSSNAFSHVDTYTFRSSTPVAANTVLSNRDRAAQFSLTKYPSDAAAGSVLFWEHQRISAPQIVLERHPLTGQYAGAVTFVPSFDTDAPKAAPNSVRVAAGNQGVNEFVFLVDCSIAMEGSNLRHARQVVEGFIATMPTNSLFNVIAFGKSSSLMWKTSKNLTAGNIKFALAWIAKMAANLGPADVFAALRGAMGTLSSSAEHRLVMLTGGIWSDVGRVLTQLKTYSEHMQLFVFGLGSGVHSQSCKDMAAAGRGKVEFVSETEAEAALQSKVSRTIRRATQPLVENWRLTFKGHFEVEHSPKVKQFPAIFSGEPFTVYGFFEPKPEKSTQVTMTLNGERPDGTKVTFPLSFDLADAVEGFAVHKLVAASLIHHLDASNIDQAEKMWSLSRDHGLISPICGLVVSESELDLSEPAPPPSARKPQPLVTYYENKSLSKKFSKTVALDQEEEEKDDDPFDDLDGDDLAAVNDGETQLRTKKLGLVGQLKKKANASKGYSPIKTVAASSSKPSGIPAVVEKINGVFYVKRKGAEEETQKQGAAAAPAAPIVQTAQENLIDFGSPPTQTQSTEDLIDF
eukprot:GILJ01001443.1.p1 GENE.GILJ01001443.1~~GILJ01001443.1.p1  ORF type:complete len:733 (+),score=114.44 GILJ01001443.1:53-2200(+)